MLLAPTPMTLPSTDLTLKIDEFSEDEWNDLVAQFEDGNFYQTWAYGAVHWPNRELVRAALCSGDGEPIGLAQVCIAKLPFLGGGVAYLRWGPLFRRFGASEAESLAVFPKLIEALKAEFVERRRLSLVALPNVFSAVPWSRALESTYEAAGFRANRQPSYRTIRLDVRPNLGVLESGLKQRWRRQLNKARRGAYEIEDGDSVELFDEFLVLYKEMLQRKKFFTFIEEDEFREMQTRLNGAQRMRVYIARSGGKAISSIVVSLVGDTGLYLLGATGDGAVAMEASYLLHWKMVEELNAKGFSYYDLGGIDPDTNPGVYQFKRGMSGSDVVHCSQFLIEGGWFLPLLVRARGALRQFLRTFRAK